MKQKISELIKAKHPKLTIPKKILDAAVAKIESKCGEDETLIEAQIEIYEDFNPIADQVRQHSQLATALAKASGTSTNDTTPADETTVTAETTPKPDDTANTLKTILAEIAGLKAEKQATTIREKVATALKEKSIANDFWSEWALPAKDEDIPAFVDKVDAKHSAFTQSLADQGILSTTPPKAGASTQKPGEAKPATKEEIDAVAKQII